LVVGVAVLTAAVTWAVAASVIDATNERAQITQTADQAATSSLAQSYTEGLAALTPEQLGWAYRSTPSLAADPTQLEDAYIEGITALTPEELGVAFAQHRIGDVSLGADLPPVHGTGWAAAYLQGIATLTPEELVAFGWHSDGSG
jgi:hypothetical protein